MKQFTWANRKNVIRWSSFSSRDRSRIYYYLESGWQKTKQCDGDPTKVSGIHGTEMLGRDTEAKSSISILSVMETQL